MLRGLPAAPSIQSVPVSSIDRQALRRTMSLAVDGYAFGGVWTMSSRPGR